LPLTDREAGHFLSRRVQYVTQRCLIRNLVRHLTSSSSWVLPCLISSEPMVDLMNVLRERERE
jgi:hypothetical protein